MYEQESTHQNIVHLVLGRFTAAVFQNEVTATVPAVVLVKRALLSQSGWDRLAGLYVGVERRRRLNAVQPQREQRTRRAGHADTCLNFFGKQTQGTHPFLAARTFRTSLLHTLGRGALALEAVAAVGAIGIAVLQQEGQSGGAV